MKKSIFLLAFLVFGCVAQKPDLMSSSGSVVSVSGCEVCVVFSVVNRSPRQHSLGCFALLNGHEYQVGDQYPDREKEGSGLYPEACGQLSSVSELLSLSEEDGQKWRKTERKRHRRMNRIRRRNGIGSAIEPQSGHLA
jgi:hypothetical protein